MTPRLKEQYRNEILPDMREQFRYANVMQVPHIDKVVVNMGVGDATQDPRLLEGAAQELSLITGQKACIRKARRSISNFKLRAGNPIGCMVTLRGDRMYEFLDRLLNVAIPRIRDFRGVSAKAFDKFGNYTLGVREHTIFPEVNVDNVARVRGVNITFVIRNSNSREESHELLRRFGMPFAR
ncbi:MAG: 50S ribosomal protein L5 [Candidatus Hydrogenedentota bacterium]